MLAWSSSTISSRSLSGARVYVHRDESSWKGTSAWDAGERLTRGGRGKGAAATILATIGAGTEGAETNSVEGRVGSVGHGKELGRNKVSDVKIVREKPSDLRWRHNVGWVSEWCLCLCTVVYSSKQYVIQKQTLQLNTN